MGHVFRLISLGTLAVIMAVGCAMPPRAGMPIPPAAQVVPADTRATVYGSTIEEVVQNPAIGDKIRAMFGADWSGGQLASPGASAYFARGGPPQMVRIGSVDWSGSAVWTTSRLTTVCPTPVTPGASSS